MTDQNLDDVLKFLKDEYEQYSDRYRYANIGYLLHSLNIPSDYENTQSIVETLLSNGHIEQMSLGHSGVRITKRGIKFISNSSYVNNTDVKRTHYVSVRESASASDLDRTTPTTQSVANTPSKNDSKQTNKIWYEKSVYTSYIGPFIIGVILILLTIFLTKLLS